MRSGERFPSDQAEVVFSDIFVEQLEDDLDRAQAEEVLSDVVRLGEDPAGSHPLHAPLTGWNTLEVLGRSRRVVYHARLLNGHPLIDVLCLGPRSNSEVYDVAEGLKDAGLLSEETFTQVWEALQLLDVTAADVGLDEWDFLPTPAPLGMQKAAVAAGVLPEDVTRLLSKDELEAAMEHGWASDGTVDPDKALNAALARNRLSSRPDLPAILARRQEPRCNEFMPRAKQRCVRRAGHPGPHRARR